MTFEPKQNDVYDHSNLLHNVIPLRILQYMNVPRISERGQALYRLRFHAPAGATRTKWFTSSVPDQRLMAIALERGRRMRQKMSLARIPISPR